jgi:starch phosphorylase
MRESMAQLTPRFSAGRAVREYSEQHYLPAAAAYRERAANKGAVEVPTPASTSSPATTVSR